MNIIKRELRAGLKPFLLWMIAVFALVFIGIIKFEGINTGGADLSKLMASLPRVFLAMLGMAGVDVNTLLGYTTVLFYYVLICTVIYSVHLGAAAVTRESVDKTYEFIFTKPRTRSFILAAKLLVGWIYLLLFCVFSFLFSVWAIGMLQITVDIMAQVLLLTLSLFLVGSMFLSLSACLSALSARADKGALWGNLAFLYAFVLGVVYDMLDNAGVLRIVSPFRYFPGAEVVGGRLNSAYIALTILLTAVFLLIAFNRFYKRDLT
jgi:ABC-2 type transport system permease protein